MSNDLKITNTSIITFKFKLLRNSFKAKGCFCESEFCEGAVFMNLNFVKGAFL